MVFPEGFILPFATVALAELGDKTQLAMLALSSKTRSHLALFGGAMAAFSLTTLLAVVFGGFISTSIPQEWIKIAGGLLFIAFGVLSLKAAFDGKEGDEKMELKSPFFTAFSLIFISELGDKTQLSAAVFASKYDQMQVFAGAILALALLTAMAIYAGKFVSERVDRKSLSLAAGALFILMGAAFALL